MKASVEGERRGRVREQSRSVGRRQSPLGLMGHAVNCLHGPKSQGLPLKCSDLETSSDMWLMKNTMIHVYNKMHLAA